MQAVPSTELHCSLRDPSAAPPCRETGTHLHIHMYACGTLPGEGATPSKVARGLSAKPYQSCMCMPHIDTIKGTYRVTHPCFMCRADSLANAEPQFHFYHAQLFTFPCWLHHSFSHFLFFQSNLLWTQTPPDLATAFPAAAILGVLAAPQMSIAASSSVLTL